MPATTKPDVRGVSIDEDGYLLVRPGYKSLAVAVSDAKGFGDAAPADDLFLPNIPLPKFVAEEYNAVTFQLSVPHDWMPGSPMTPFVQFIPAGELDGNAQFTLDIVVVKSFGATTRYSLTTTVDKVVLAGSVNHVLTAFAADPIPGADLEVDAVIFVQLMRTEPSERPYAGDVFGVTAGVKYQSDRLSTMNATKGNDFYDITGPVVPEVLPEEEPEA